MTTARTGPQAEYREALAAGDGGEALEIQNREARKALDALGMEGLPLTASWADFRKESARIDERERSSPVDSQKPGAGP